MRNDSLAGRGRPATAVLALLGALAAANVAAQLEEVATGTVILDPNEIERLSSLEQNQSVTLINQVGATNEAVGAAIDSFSKSVSLGVNGPVPIAGGLRVSGAAAGEGFGYPWGMWVSYQHSDFDDDFASTAFDADTDAVLVGADFSPWDNFVFGVALGYDSTDIDTTFNFGEQDLDTFTVAPYLGAYISEYLGVDFDLSLSMSLGYSKVDIDQFRRTTAAGARITSDTDSDRWFFNSTVNAGQQYGNLYAGGHVGLLVARDDVDGYTESDGTTLVDQNIDLGRLSVGGDLAYTWNWLEPFASVTYQYDYQREDVVTAGVQPANDDDDVRFGLGLRFYGIEGVTGSFEWNKTVGREDFDEETFTILLRAEF